MTMGQDAPYKLVDELPANEFLNLEGRQFSKSDGWTIDLERFFTEFTPDQIRFYLAANAPESQDSEFTWKEFQSACNAQLLGKYGNLANRTLVFAQKHCEGKIPSLSCSADDKTFLEKVAQLAQSIQQAYASFHLRRASQLIMELATAGNVYFDAKKPWVLAKDPKTRKEMETAIGCCLKCLQVLALVSSPIIPASAQKLWELIGYETELQTLNWSAIMDEKLSRKPLYLSRSLSSKKWKMLSFKRKRRNLEKS
jgi:methionyl-tRNA synthetase